MNFNCFCFCFNLPLLHFHFLLLISPISLTAFDLCFLLSPLIICFLSSPFVVLFIIITCILHFLSFTEYGKTKADDCFLENCLTSPRRLNVFPSN